MTLLQLVRQLKLVMSQPPAPPSDSSRIFLFFIVAFMNNLRLSVLFSHHLQLNWLSIRKILLLWFNHLLLAWLHHHLLLTWLHHHLLPPGTSRLVLDWLHHHLLLARLHNHLLLAWLYHHMLLIWLHHHMLLAYLHHHLLLVILFVVDSPFACGSSIVVIATFVVIAFVPNQATN